MAIVKRSIDIFCAISGLVVCLPILLVVACWVKIDSQGSVFFKQVRVGKNGSLFKIIKFRSMVVKQDSAIKVTAGNDPRITKAGKFLRRYKIDELPQLWNVLVGQMSMVGPRPEVPEYMAKYPEKDRKLILSVKPGITDLASLRFYDEEKILQRYQDPLQAYFTKVLPKKLSYNRFYIKHQSVAFDLYLMLLTLGAIAGYRK